MMAHPREDSAKRQAESAKTRVDHAHLAALEAAQAARQSEELLTQVVGRDPTLAGQQLRLQALELAGQLREKQRHLDQRESEINARLAAMENEMRSARLKAQLHQLPASPPTEFNDQPLTPDTAAESWAPSPEDASPEDASKQAPRPCDPANTRPLQQATLQQWRTSIRGLVGSEQATEPRTERPSEEESHDVTLDVMDSLETDGDLGGNSDILELAECGGDPTGNQHDMLDAPRRDRDSSDILTLFEPEENTSDPAAAMISDRAHQSSHNAAVQQAPLEEQAETAENCSATIPTAEPLQHDVLVHREQQLNRRQKLVEQMYDEILELHREAIEMRLATEQLWAQLSQEYPAEELGATLSRLRAKLADHYQLALRNLTQRREEMHQLRNQLGRQERELRNQRRDVQLWVDRRYNEIEARAANLMAREHELAQQEAELDRQSLQWQQQREAYRREIEKLTRRLQRTAI